LTTSDAQWRIPLAIQIVPAVVLFAGMFFLPYSPRWLASVGREDEARSALVRLHGGERRADMDIIEAEFSEIQAQISWERENVSTSPLDLVRTRPNLHRTLCGCLVQAMCQWTGGELAGPRLVIPRRSSPAPHVCSGHYPIPSLEPAFCPNLHNCFDSALSQSTSMHTLVC
jgi:hypothetical protein